MDFHDRPLGRKLAPDQEHVAKYPARLATPTISVNRRLSMPMRFRSVYDQGNTPACTAFAASWIMSFYNRRRYDPLWLYGEEKKIDGAPTEDGSNERYAFDVLRTQGHVRVFHKKDQAPNVDEGISENRWCQSVDEMRAAILNGDPVAIGINWYENFDSPVKDGANYVIGKGNLGRIRGGHEICVYGALDYAQSFVLLNSWGPAYPIVLLPYTVMEREFSEGADAGVVTDRPTK